MTDQQALLLVAARLEEERQKPTLAELFEQKLPPEERPMREIATGAKILSFPCRDFQTPIAEALDWRTRELIDIFASDLPENINDDDDKGGDAA